MKFLKNLLIGIILLFLLGVALKLASPALLKQYVIMGSGDCEKIPVLCAVPPAKPVAANIDQSFLSGLIPYKFEEVSALLPKGFIVVNERITKIYYKRNPRRHKQAVIYLLHENPNFFLGLFPQAAKFGIKNDYDFFKRLMYSSLNNINTIFDAFFVIAKSIFIPNLGGGKDTKILEFTIKDKKGFIAYTLSGENYFDCNLFNQRGDFFKMYIKDKNHELDLDKVLTIISSISAI